MPPKYCNVSFASVTTCLDESCYSGRAFVRHEEDDSGREHGPGVGPEDSGLRDVDILGGTNLFWWVRGLRVGRRRGIG